MITKEPLKKQVIISISKNNANVIRSQHYFRINSINRHLKDINSKTSADFICTKISIIIITNQATSVQDISIIKKTLKDIENVNQNFIKSPCLPKFKLYLKILDLPYYLENTNDPITFKLVKEVIKESMILLLLRSLKLLRLYLTLIQLLYYK